MRTASRCAASRCGKSAAAKNEYRRCAPNNPSGRRGNAAPWKAWKTPKASFPPFPPGLEIRHKTAGFPHFHRAGGELVHEKGDEKDEEKTEFQLTDSITSSTIRTPASLRSENDQLHLGTSDWDPIGITNHLYRNEHLLPLVVQSRGHSNTCPENGFSSRAVWIIPLSPTNPRRMSVTPATIQILVPAGRPIMPATLSGPGAGLPYPPRP